MTEEQKFIFPLINLSEIGYKRAHTIFIRQTNTNQVKKTPILYGCWIHKSNARQKIKPTNIL